MKKFFKKHHILFLSIFVFLFAFAFRMWNLGEAGQVWDEVFLLRDYAYYHVRDALNMNWGSDYWWKLYPDHPPLVRYLRGFVALADIQGYRPDGLPIYRYDLFYDRMLSVFLTSFAAVIVFLIGARYITLFTGITAGIIFSMLPIPLGHSQLAMLEPLGIFFFTASMFTFFLFLEKPNKKRLTLAGIALGFALLARETHLMLYPMMLIMMIIKNKTTKTKFSKKLLYQIFGIFGISFLTFFCFWPMPFFHLDYMIDFFWKLRLTTTTSIPEVFFGKLMFVPIPYYFVYFIITTPLIILILCLIGLKKIDRSKKWVWYCLVLWLCFPFLMSFYPKKEQGIRYIIQITIPLSLIAALGYETLISKLTTKFNYKLLFLIPLFVYQFIILWRITPYYIDYFNILVGGAKGVYEKRLFHLAWWGEGSKEAGDYINAHAPKGATVGIAANPSHTFPPMPGKKVSLYEKNKKYDYVIVNFYNVVRIGFDDSEIKRNYNVVYSVMADGAPIVQVYQRK